MTARTALIIALCLAIIGWLWMGSALLPEGQVADGSQVAAKRIACLDPGITEVVLRLDAEDQLVARHSHTDEFETIAHLPTVGTGITPHYEGIVRARPDLILLSGASGTVFHDLSSIAPTISLPWLSVADIGAGIRAVGTALDRAPAAELLAVQIEQGLQDRVTAESPEVLLLIGAPSDARPDLWYIKDNSLHGAALRAAGGRNAIPAANLGTASISIEHLLELDPKVVVMMIADPGANEQILADHRSFWARFEQLRAVREGRIRFLVGGQHFYTGPGILNLVRALEGIIHAGPEAQR